MVVRLGTPPTDIRPGFQVVRRSEGMMVRVVTLTVAVPLLVGFAMLVATTWYVPDVAGALYVREASTIPPPTSCTDQRTSAELPPLTAAAKERVALMATVAWCGVTVTETGAEAGV